jgi:AraC family transcriptional regulator of adaptative response/methylated-DNA-[protein]-cysteine methyltransferase
MVSAFLASDTEYDGLFLTGVRTTGIFCKPSCSARKPRPENVEFFRSIEEALAAGYRACLRCRPTERPGETPEWVAGLMEAAEREPDRRWRESDLLARGLNPDRVRRWFRAEYGMTFHAWQRARRLGGALAALRAGKGVLHAAWDHGFDSPSGFSDAVRRLTGAAPAQARGARTVHLRRIETPLGPMLAGAADASRDGEGGVCLLEFTDRRMLERQLGTLQRRMRCTFLPDAPGGEPVLDALAAELERYFAGALTRFEAPLVLSGSEFQRAVWRRLCGIPCGGTMSYAELARAVGRPSAVRAVARANGDNRLAILVPCHRVIGSDGQLTGYGGGVWRKQWLLDLERRVDLERRAAPGA